MEKSKMCGEDIEANGKMFWIRGYVEQEKCEKNRNFDRRSEGKGSIKGEMIREQHPVGPQADRECSQGSKALGIFTLLLKKTSSKTAFPVKISSDAQKSRFFHVNCVHALRFFPS
jgi:hypothetical protein